MSVILSAQCETYEYDNIFDASWLSCETAEHPALDSAQHWIQYDLGSIRNLGATHFWNYNITDSTHLGVKEINIYTSINNNSWELIAKDTLEEASGLLSYNGEPGPDLSSVTASHILIAVTNNHGGQCSGLSEVKLEFGDSHCNSLEIEVEITKTNCNNSFLASANITATGEDDSSYNYFWSNGQDSSFVDSLQAGVYHILVIDDQNCSKVFDIIIDSVQTDTSIFDSNDIKSGTYFYDTLHSSGRLITSSSVNFLFSEETILQEGFTIENGGVLCINLLDCQTDSTSTWSTLKNLTLGIPVNTHRGFIGLGNTKYVIVTSSHEDSSELSINTLNGEGNLDELSAARFLSQSTLGYDHSMISEVSELGIEEWMNHQFRTTSESYFNHFTHNIRRGQTRIKYFEDFHRTWWHNTLSGNEYLRERVAFALSQIFVISSKSFLLNYGDGLTSYYDLLSNNAFGNYRDLLSEVTMHPMMGFYLSHLNNAKTDATLNRFPDENYAREVLQLFSIGLYELNIDGTRKKDSQNQNIPTYTNEDIIEFAKVFTGLGFNNRDFGTPGNQRLLPYTMPMQMNEEHHEQGVKHLLNGDSIVSGQLGIKDINDAIDNIFNHPNVGPFISIRLIQRLVKSEPSPEYIQRVAEVFNDNGSGVRGDLKAVVKAILLDNEARNCEFLDDPTHGMLREPLPRIIHLLKAFGISNTTNNFYALGTHIEDLTHQAPLRAPSVFNFYQPDHTAPGVLSDSMVRSPEFAILDSYSSIGYLNLVDSISANIGVLDVEEGLATLDFSEELAAASDANSLINILDKKLTYGHLSERTKNIMEESINLVGADPADRVRMAIYIIANSPDYTILR